MFLLRNPILQNIPKTNFRKNYFMDFSIVKYIKGDKIFIEGENAKTIYFIKNGEFKLTMKKNITEINGLIKYFGGRIKKERHETNLLKDNQKLQKYYDENFITNLGSVKDNDTLGLKDCILNDQYIFSAECVSTSGEIFVIQSQVIIYKFY